MKKSLGEMIAFKEAMKKLGFEVRFNAKGEVKGVYNPKLVRKESKNARV